MLQIFVFMQYPLSNLEYYTIILREDGQLQKNSWSEELEWERGGRGVVIAV